MATDDSEAADGSSPERCLSLIGELFARPFSEVPYRDDTSWGGKGHHLRILRASREFWEDDDGAAARAAEADLQAHLDALITILSARWGKPVTVDLRRYLRASFEGGSVPEPIDSLCQLAGSMQVWVRPETGRWLALTIGQGDKELPLELLAAVGEIPVLDPAVAGRS